MGPKNRIFFMDGPYVHIGFFGNFANHSTHVPISKTVL